MPERKTVTIDVGPLYTRGDLVKAPDGTSSKAKNCVFRRGVVEKRPGFLADSSTAIAQKLYELNTATETILVASSLPGLGGYLDAYRRASDGTWAALTGANAAIGAVEYENVLYMLGADNFTTSTPSRVDSYDGTTVTTTATTTAIGGRAIGTHIGRLVIGSPKFYHDNGGSYLFSYNVAGEWTVSGAWSQPTGVSVRLATIANATTDTIKSTASVYTTGSTEEYVTAVFEIQAVSATTSTPIKVRLENSTGATIYGQTQSVVSNATDDPEWRQYWVTALVPAATSVYAALQIGNDSGGGTVGVQLRLSDDTAGASHGFSVYQGRFIYPFGAQSSVVALEGEEYVNRIYWSEPLDFTDWRNENFAKVDESPGYVTAIGAVNGRLVVFKANGMWVFAPTESALNPFVRELYIPKLGCVGGTALTVFENVMYFVSNGEIYSFDGASRPKPLCGEAVRDDVFGTQTVIYTASVAVDSDNRELWAYVRDTRIFIYSIDTGAWIGYYELPDNVTHITFSGPRSMLYTQPRGESKREMWMTIQYSNDLLSEDQTYCLKLRASATQDFATTDIVAEYVFHPLEAPRWRKQMTVQRFGIDHKITGSQSASTTEYSVSLDGGSTWSKYNQVRLPVTSGGALDTDPIRVPLFQTAPRICVKVKHTGLGGPTYFNMTGAEAEIVVHGREIQAANPTAVGSSL